MKLYLLAYSISRLILSSSVMPPRPLFLICQSPVMPAGARKRCALSSVVRVAASYKGNGRFPTRTYHQAVHLTIEGVRQDWSF